MFYICISNIKTKQIMKKAILCIGLISLGVILTMGYNTLRETKSSPIPKTTANANAGATAPQSVVSQPTEAQSKLEYEESIPLEYVKTPLTCYEGGNCVLVYRENDKHEVVTVGFDKVDSFIDDMNFVLDGTGEYSFNTHEIKGTPEGISIKFKIGYYAPCTINLTSRQVEKFAYDLKHPKRN